MSLDHKKWCDADVRSAVAATARAVASAVVSECPASFSSGSWSQTVDPSSTRPTRLRAPAR